MNRRNLNEPDIEGKATTSELLRPEDDIIAAVATARGAAGIAVVRVSGAGSLELARKVFAHRGGGEIAPRRMTFGDFVDREGRVLDEGYLVYLPAPSTFTGQEIVELHTHGGLAAPAAVLSRLAELGARMAEAGEFTRRALISGRIDLAQAEAVLDVVHARSEAALRAAHTRLAGALSGRVTTIRERLIAAKALVEAKIDFENGDLGDVDASEIGGLLRGVRDDLTALAGTYRRGRIFREGAAAVIAGRPNVGKSSLLNALLGRRRAIVSDAPGTTRDAVEDEAVLAGVPFRLTDTAGLRREAGKIESAGIEIARERMAQADLIVFVFDASEGWTPEDAELRTQLPAAPVIVVANKIDKVITNYELRITNGEMSGREVTENDLKAMKCHPERSEESTSLPGRCQILRYAQDDRIRWGQSPIIFESNSADGGWDKIIGDCPLLKTCAISGFGVEELAGKMAAAVSGEDTGGEEAALLAHERHHQQTTKALARVEAALAAHGTDASPAIVALEIADAQKALGEILGDTTPDDVLNHIFSRFCVGK